MEGAAVTTPRPSAAQLRLLRAVAALGDGTRLGLLSARCRVYGAAFEHLVRSAWHSRLVRMATNERLEWALWIEAAGRAAITAAEDLNQTHEEMQHV